MPPSHLSTRSGLSDEVLLEISRKARLQLVRQYGREKRVLEWGRLLFPDKFSLPFCDELHNYLVSIRREELTNTEAPRNHSKTTIKCFLVPIFQALNEPEEFRHYLNVQATGTKSMSVNMSLRAEFEQNEDLMEVYGKQIGTRWTDGQFVLKNGVVFTSIGAGQSIRGLNYRNIRPDYIIIDDLYDEEDINNPEATLKKNQWFWGSLYPARAKSRRSSIHVQGTAINQEDLLERLKSQQRWVSKTFKAIKNYGTPQAEVLWPQLNTIHSLEKDKMDMGSIIFFRELQNERREETTAIIKRSWLTYFSEEEMPPTDTGNCQLSAVLLGVDPSIGRDISENDPTACALVYKTQFTDNLGGGCEWWIMNVWSKHLSLNERVLLLKKISDDQPTGKPITHLRIEAISGFQDFSQEVIRRTNLPVTEIDKVKDKISNLESKSHFFENKKIHINRHIDPVLLDQLVYQLTTNHPLHDDIRDAILLTLDADSGIWNFV